MMKINFQKIGKNKGYTLLFAVLVSSLVLAIGISILNISKKEFLIATSTRDSTSALYAADSGLECAIYGEWGTLSTGEFRDSFNPGTNKTANLGCNVTTNFTPTPSFNSPNPGEGTFVFHAKFSTDDIESRKSCAIVTITKRWETVNSVQRLRTKIESRGYNVGWNSTNSTCTLFGPKTVERALLYQYI